MKAIPVGILSTEGGIALVKGISRQVIVVHSKDQKLFDQAIFILKDHVVGREGITDEQLLKEAGGLLQSHRPRRRRFSGPLWAGIGALVMGLAWLLTSLL